MARLVQWEQQIGRRVRLRDLFVFFTVVEYSSMALGIRALVAMAMGFYVGSLLCLRWASTQTLTDRY